MELSLNFIQAVQDMVLKPDFTGAIIILWSSFLNELVAFFPYAVVLSGQLLFLKSSLSLALIAKLLVFVAVPVGVGTTLGTLPAYGLSYYGGKPAIEKFGKYLRLSWPNVEKVASKFKGTWYDEIIFLAIQSTPLLPFLPVSVAAGILRMRLLPYFILTFIGATIRMMIMLTFVGLGAETLAQ